MTNVQKIYDKLSKEYLDKKYDIKNILPDVSIETNNNVINGIIALQDSGYHMTTLYEENDFNIENSYIIGRAYDMVSITHLDISTDDKKKVKDFTKDSIINGILYERVNEFIIPDISYIICEYLHDEPLFKVSFVANGLNIYVDNIYNFPYQMIKNPIPICSIPFSVLYIQVESKLDNISKITIGRHNIYLNTEYRNILMTSKFVIPCYNANISYGCIYMDRHLGS